MQNYLFLLWISMSSKPLEGVAPSVLVSKFEVNPFINGQVIANYS